MKKLILAFATIAITAGAYAQTGSTNRNMNPREINKSENQNMQNRSEDGTHPDGVMMKNGKMVKLEAGKKSNLDNEVTMSNGTKVMSDGSYIRRDGTRMTLREGQHIDNEGNLTMRKTNKDKDMHLVPDSTKSRDF